MTVMCPAPLAPSGEFDGSTRQSTRCSNVLLKRCGAMKHYSKGGGAGPRT